MLTELTIKVDLFGLMPMPKESSQPQIFKMK